MPPAPSTPFRIVINYRRDDTAGHAGRLYDALAARFGPDHVFMDIDAIEPGVDFTEVLDRAVDSCDAFISLIGRTWLTAADPQGARRLDNPGDFVRLEIEAALGRDIRVIPVLVQEAEMPTVDALPPSLAPLAYRNATEIRDTSWRADVERLIRALEKVRLEKAEQLSGGDGEDSGPTLLSRLPRRVLLAALGVAGVIALGALLAVVLRDDGGGDGGGGGGGDIVYGDGTRLVAVASDGSGSETPGPEGSSPDWSPDADRIAFVQDGGIVVMNPDQTERSRLTSGSPVDDAPDWSPDGTRIAFDRAAGDGSTDILLIDPEGGGEQPLTEGSETGGAPDWSADGDQIVYQRRGQLWIMNADGSDKHAIATDVRGTKLSPAWSPDGELIAFALYPGEGNDPSHLYVMRPDGSGARPLTSQRLFRVNYPAWSADGERLVFTTQGGLWIIDRDGGSVEDVPSGPNVETPTWAAPD